MWKPHFEMLMDRVNKGSLISKIANGPDGKEFRGIEMVADAVDYLFSRKSMGKVIVDFNTVSKF